MNIKKYLKQREEEASEALLTEEDRIFCRQLAEKYCAMYAEEANKNPRRRKEKRKISD